MSSRPPSPLPKHGRPSTYVNWGCRCEKCRKANADAQRIARARRAARLRGAA